MRWLCFFKLREQLILNSWILSFPHSGLSRKICRFRTVAADFRENNFGSEDDEGDDNFGDGSVTVSGAGESEQMASEGISACPKLSNQELQ